MIDGTTDGRGATPPPEVLEALDKAAHVLMVLERRQLTLSLSHRGTEGHETIGAVVRDHAGSVLRELSDRQLLEILSGTVLDGELGSRHLLAGL